MASIPEFGAQWMRQWREARVALARQRALELRSMTEAEAMAATLALLDIASATPLRPERETWSGLVRQQELLARGSAER